MTEPAQSIWITGDGSFGDLAFAPEDVRAVVEAKKWKSVTDGIKSYSELEKHISGKIDTQIDALSEFTPELTGKIMTKLGRPESPDKYEFKYDGTIPLDEQLLTGFKKHAHSLNLTNKQFSDVVKFQLDAIAEAQKAQESQNKQRLEDVAKALKDEWKENYDGNFKKAKETAQKLEILDELESLGLADNPRVIKLMHNLNSKVSESAIKVQPSSAVDSKQEMDSLLKSDAFKNRMHPDHKAVHARFLELCGIKQG